jgi:fibronectin type 3 domain-containing protein
MVVSLADSEQPCVLLKYFDEKFIFPEGINIYRTEISHDKSIQYNDKRIRLNDKPIKKGDYKIPSSAFASDTTLKQYQDILDELNPSEIEGIMAALLLIKALQSTPFSLYSGIMFEDSKVKMGATYSYEVFRLVKGKEVLIEKSKPIKVERFQAEKAPDSVQIEVGDSKAFIRWKPDEKRFWGVNVYRKIMDDSVFSRINAEPVMISLNKNEKGEEAYPDVFITDENLQNGVTYMYQIAGIDFFSRETEWSEPIAVTPKDQTQPLPPKEIKAEFNAFNIELSWQCEFKSRDMKGFYIYRSKGRFGEQIRITPQLLDKEAIAYTDKALREAGTYHYFVASVDSSGNEARGFRTIIEILDVFPPEPPSNFKVTADTGRMILTWQSPTEADFAGCRIYRTTNTDKKLAYALLNVNLIKDTVFIDVLPKNSKSDFLYRITALDSSLNMSEYTEVGVGKMPDITSPSSPVLTNIEQDKESIVLHWDISPESDVKAYNIYRFEPKDSANTYIRLSRQALSPTSNLFTDRILKHKTEYAYKLFAIDSSGHISQPSEQKRLTFLSERTDLYTFKMEVSVRRNGKRVILTWDLDTDETPDFIVYKRLSGTDEFVAISTLTKDLNFTDTSLEKGDRCEYQVRAYLSEGTIFKSNTFWVERKK